MRIIDFVEDMFIGANVSIVDNSENVIISTDCVKIKSTPKKITSTRETDYISIIIYEKDTLFVNKFVEEYVKDNLKYIKVEIPNRNFIIYFKNRAIGNMYGMYVQDIRTKGIEIRVKPNMFYGDKEDDIY